MMKFKTVNHCFNAGAFNADVDGYAYSPLRQDQPRCDKLLQLLQRTWGYVAVGVTLVLSATSCTTPKSNTTKPSTLQTATRGASHSPAIQRNLGSVTKSSGCTSVDGLPDMACTPGAVDDRVTQENLKTTICVTGYSASVRPSTNVTNPLKVESMKAYGINPSLKAEYEFDHLVPLSLGGLPVAYGLDGKPAKPQPNLFPMPEKNPNWADSKDRLERTLQNRVCKGEIPLAIAQKKIAANWKGAYKEIFGSPPLVSSTSSHAMNLQPGIGLALSLFTVSSSSGQ